MHRPTLLSLGILLLPATAGAADQLMMSADGQVVFRGSYGITAIEANELVYNGKRKLSQLIWESTAVSTLTGEVKVDLDPIFLRGSASIGLGGDGNMRNYDWLEDGRPWSHRSVHPDNRLNHYFTSSLEVGRTVLSLDDTTASLSAGIKFTDVKWTAWGGSYVYSDSGFRKDRGRFDPDERSISYRQQWPVPFLGLDVTHTEGPWRFGGAFQGGLALGGQGTDDHWMRDLRFVDHVETTPAMMISASAEYEVRPAATIFVAGAFDQVFRGRADTVIIDKLSGDRLRLRDGAGADFMSMTLSLGLRGKF